VCCVVCYLVSVQSFVILPPFDDDIYSENEMSDVCCLTFAAYFCTNNPTAETLCVDGDGLSVSCDFVGCDVLLSCRWLPTFQCGT
jgi:hypothetical protein